MSDLARLSIRIFADGADLAGILRLRENTLIKGFTTNPTLMRQAGIKDYETFAREILETVPGYPVSFEVFADEFPEMERQARKIAGWSPDVYVKIPVTTTGRASTAPLVRRLADDGIQLNVTALLTLGQVQRVHEALLGGPPSFVSVFAGRIADTGRDPVPLMAEAVRILESNPAARLIWASPRELLNVFQADQIGCHVITVTHDLLKKLALVGRDLDDYSLETVQMFYNDGRAAGYQL
jgi:transaldolase